MRHTVVGDALLQGLHCSITATPCLGHTSHCMPALIKRSALTQLQCACQQAHSPIAHNDNTNLPGSQHGSLSLGITAVGFWTVHHGTIATHCTGHNLWSWGRLTQLQKGQRDHVPQWRARMSLMPQRYQGHERPSCNAWTSGMC